MLKLPDREHTNRGLEEGRYLLFDSGCSTCTEIAQAVENETDGWLTARSLREAEVQEILSEARPDWKWEPTLLEIAGDKAIVFTGLSMKTRMLMGLGPRRATRVARIARQNGASDIEIALAPSREDPKHYTIESVKRIDRLSALKTLGAFGLAAMALPWIPNAATAQEAAGRAIRLRSSELSSRQASVTFQSILRRYPEVRGCVRKIL